MTIEYHKGGLNMRINLEKAKRLSKGVKFSLSINIDEELNLYPYGVNFICSEPLGNQLKRMEITDYFAIERPELEKIRKCL